ncbi:hypothetical protein BROUX41_005667 [Berkeleyomyces rouxiae]|uniref:uncharacterized protein n=1 Tax=Berkeleyomyces rouxiae TaxID=2035830 RepID=UPI003B818081
MAFIGAFASRVAMAQPGWAVVRTAATRSFSAFFAPWGKNNQLPPRPKPPPEVEIQESFLKGSGPGGQKINKTSSAVQLKHLPTGIVVKSQATRSRTQNRNIARELLAQRLDELYSGENSRTNIVSTLKKKRQMSAAKKSRRKYRTLETEKQAAGLKGSSCEEGMTEAAADGIVVGLVGVEDSHVLCTLPKHPASKAVSRQESTTPSTPK